MAVLKYSRQRESIRKNLCARKDHPTADMVYEDIRAEFPNISLGTVYRNLSLLVELGEAQKLRTDGPDRFDANTALHHHFICRSCGSMLDVRVPLADPAAEAAAAWDGGEIESCSILFYGICNSCKKNK